MKSLINYEQDYIWSFNPPDNYVWLLFTSLLKNQKNELQTQTQKRIKKSVQRKEASHKKDS